MRIYSVSGSNPAKEPDIIYVGTLTDAKPLVKNVAPVFRAEVLVEELEVPTDKSNIVRLLNGDDTHKTVIRSWRGSARGGLREVEEKSA